MQTATAAAPASKAESRPADTSVRIDGEPTFLEDYSETSTSIGDEGGTLAGVPPSSNPIRPSQRLARAAVSRSGRDNVARCIRNARRHVSSRRVDRDERAGDGHGAGRDVVPLAREVELDLITNRAGEGRGGHVGTRDDLRREPSRALPADEPAPRRDPGERAGALRRARRSARPARRPVRLTAR